MQIRTFQATTVQGAMQQVKKELGPDAVILGNRKITVTPTRSLIEITAARDRIDTQPGAEMPSSEARQQVGEDIREIKGLLSMLISSKNTFSQLQLQEPVARVYHHLLMRGLDEKQTFIAIKRALSGMNGGPLDEKRVMHGFCRQVLEKISIVAPFRDTVPVRPDVFAFIGPTGVGKTTTLAKLAAFLKVQRHARVGVVSLDTYRIGALDQLRIYADILELPLLVAQNTTELLDSVERLQHMDVILIDTVGKNYLREQHVKDLQEAFSGCPKLQHFLVLSAAAKDEDLRLTIKRFHEFKINSLIFTKIDETLTPGSMINQLLQFPYPISYVGTGQRVPEDLEPASRKLLLGLLLTPEKGGHEKE
jgi:flagellar biosynthesis protein FlhF